MMFIGDDWAEAHHDIEIEDDTGRMLARRRLPEGLAGITTLHELVAEHLDPDGEPEQVIVGIETDRGPWVQALIAAGYQVYAINPLQVARYRERHSTSGAKSDPADAHLIAEIVRLDRAHHRLVAGDSELAEHLKVATRAHQTMIWSRVRQVNALRSLLREYYPATLDACGNDLADREALAVLAAAPTPEQGRRLSQARIGSLLRRAGRKRNLTTTAAKIKTALGTAQLGARPGVVPAYAASASALVAVLTTMVAQTEVLAGQVEQGLAGTRTLRSTSASPAWDRSSAPGCLAEFGDDPNRYVDAKARKNYSGMSPITKASGTRRVVLARFARNRRLGDALLQQAYSALRVSPDPYPQSDHAQMLGEMDPVDHDRDQIEPGQVLGQCGLGHRHELPRHRRLAGRRGLLLHAVTNRFQRDRVAAGRHPASIRSSAIRPSNSVEENS